MEFQIVHAGGLGAHRGKIIPGLNVIAHCAADHTKTILRQAPRQCDKSIGPLHPPYAADPQYHIRTLGTLPHRRRVRIGNDLRISMVVTAQQIRLARRLRDHGIHMSKPPPK